MLPKNKIYEHASPSTAVKNLFVRQVEQIVWQYKLAPETVNLKPSRAVPEIQIFRIVLKTGELKYDVLHCIDQAIPFPILFELRYEGKIQAIAAFKRPSDADSSKWVVSDYFESAWLPSEAPRTPLPVVFDLEALYAHLLTPLDAFSGSSWRRLAGLCGKNGADPLQTTRAGKMRSSPAQRKTIQSQSGDQRRTSRFETRN